MPLDIRKLKAEPQHRSFTVSTRAVDEEARTVEVAFSSEEPYERWWGVEILDHSDGAVDMSRMNSGAAVLVDHDSRDLVGVVESSRIDSDRVGRAVHRFGNSARASEIFRDVADEIRKNISVGYMIDEMVLEEQSKDGPDVYRVTKWTPFENSYVAVPADASVGVGRAASTQTEAENMPDEITEPGLPAVEVPEVETPVIAVDRTAVDAEIRGLALQYGRAIPNANELADDVIGLSLGKDEMLASLRAAYKAREAVPVQAVSRQPQRMEMQIPRRTGKLRSFANDKQGVEDAYRSGMWALGAVFGDKDALRWCKDYGVRVMTGTTSTTSSVVPDEMVLPIIDLRESYGVARQQCYVHPMSSDTATVPRRKSGVTAYFPGREDATTASDAQFDDINLVAREVSALTRLSNSYMEDSAINLADHLTGEMAYSFAVKEDACLINGTGDNTTYGGIYGILPKAIDGNHTVSAVEAAATHDLLSELDADDLLSVTGALPEYPGIMPKWFTSKLGNALVFEALKAAAGGNTIGDLGARPSLQWLGDEIVISQSMPKVATTLDTLGMLIYGDLRMGVTMGDRMGIEVNVLTERYAEYRQTGIIATERMDIVVHGLGDTSAAGPIMVLYGNVA